MHRNVREIIFNSNCENQDTDNGDAANKMTSSFKKSGKNSFNVAKDLAIGKIRQKFEIKGYAIKQIKPVKYDRTNYIEYIHDNQLRQITIILHF